MKVAFLDRDGVINEDLGYIHSWEQFTYKKLVKPALKTLIDSGYKLVIVTNQSGIARGFYTENDFNLLTEVMQEDLKNSGIHLLDIFYCPHHQDAIIERYKIKCNCRKPKPGLFFQATEKYDIKLLDSVMFGDQESDMKASHAAGIQNRFIIGDQPTSKLASGSFVNLKEAVDNLLIQEQHT